jgi:hypothetical protein
MEPWQTDLFNKLAAYNNSDIRIVMGRQSGKSVFYQLYREFMNKPAKRFQVAGPVDGVTSHLLVIEDYMWWTTNEREILNWMANNLPRGIDHQQGMIITFDSEQDRMMFLLRWS